MKLIDILRTALIGLGVSMALVQSAGAQTRLGLHVTQEELNIWRQRAVSGPYKSQSDVSTNSPGDWSRLVADKNTFVTNRASNSNFEYWTGTDLTVDSSGCVQIGSPALPESNRALGTYMQNAAFFILVNPTDSARQTIASNVRTLLINMAAQPRLNWANTRLWCVNIVGDQNPFFGIAQWHTRVLFAYDYLKIADELGITSPAVLSTGDKASLDTWFSNAAHFWRQVLYRTTQNALFSDAGSIAADALPTTFKSPATGSGGYCASPANPSQIYHGSPMVWTIQEYFNNRKNNYAVLMANVGAMLNDAELKNRAKQWAKMFLAYNVQEDSSSAEMCRWRAWNGNIHPGLGWQYAMSVSQLIYIADPLARVGDTSLYDYTTTVTMACGRPAH